MIPLAPAPRATPRRGRSGIVRGLAGNGRPSGVRSGRSKGYGAYRPESHDGIASAQVGCGCTGAVGAIASADVGTSMIGNSTFASRLLSSSPALTLPLSLRSAQCQRPRISSADLPDGAYSLTARPDASASW